MNTASAQLEFDLFGQVDQLAGLGGCKRRLGLWLPAAAMR